uniref:Envelope protein n=1 Tax=Echeneis naucrates TaxID=173247 RepID=A0A665TEN1_ECHNA
MFTRLRIEPHHDKWCWLGVITLTGVIVVSLMFYESSFRDADQTPPLNHSKRSTQSTDCIDRYGGIELKYTMGQNTGFQFDLCSVINCGNKEANWRGYDVYLCMLTNKGRWCPTWDSVLTWTGVSWTPRPCKKGKWCARDKVNLQRQTYQSHQGSHEHNPILLSVYNLTQNPLPRGPCSTTDGTAYFILGVHHPGTDTKGLIKITFLQPPPPNKTSMTTPQTDTASTPAMTVQKEGIISIDYSKLTRSDMIKIATGYGDRNLWLDWIAATASSMNMSNCVACSSARPTMFTTPAPLFPEEDPRGFNCMINMTMFAEPSGCRTLSSVFPVVKNHTVPPTFTPKKNNYTCFHRNLSSGQVTDMGHMQMDWCNHLINMTTWANASTMIIARGDLFWYCGDKTLHLSLPASWSGTCAMVRLAVPLVLLGSRDTGSAHNRRKRNTFEIGTGSTTYMDSIGIPRGVPDEYKLADQVAAGFENMPILSALFPITPNKNVDRINYVHYNVLRLANATRDAVSGLSEQLAATSLMTVQNRIALDMLLAEKGGVCSMFQGLCCTFIPNNTAPDGSVTRALEGLRTLSQEMHDNSGINNPFGGVFEQWFGKWKNLVVSVLLSLIGMIAVLGLCGCCCIPCIRSLCERMIVAAVEKKSPYPPPPYQMAQIETTALLGNPSPDSESEVEV